jgi:hypothetical protein
MAETKADTANTQKATAKAATKSAAEAENLPSASAPAVTSEAEATKSDTTLTAGEAEKVASDASEGEFGPFKDTAPPVGAALDATTDPDNIDTSLDFPDTSAFTETVGDVVVAVRQHNSRNVVEIAPAGWTGPGQVFAPYQAKLLHQALGKVVKKLK